MKKMDVTVKEYQEKGYVIVKRSEMRINNRYYAFVIMSKDGKTITVNHQGGVNGLVSVGASKK